MTVGMQMRSRFMLVMEGFWILGQVTTESIDTTIQRKLFVSLKPLKRTRSSIPINRLSVHKWQGTYCKQLVIHWQRIFMLWFGWTCFVIVLWQKRTSRLQRKFLEKTSLHWKGSLFEPSQCRWWLITLVCQKLWWRSIAMLSYAWMSCSFKVYCS